MKKLLALLLALMMLLSVATVFAGCEDSGEKKSASSKNDEEDEEEEEEDEETEGEDGEDADEDGGETTEDDGEDVKDDSGDDTDKDDTGDEEDEKPVQDDEEDEKPQKPSATVDEADVEKAIQNYLDLVYGSDPSVIYDCVTEEMYEYEMGYTGYAMEDIADLMDDSDFMEVFYENDYDYYRENCGADMTATIDSLTYDALNSKAEDRFRDAAEIIGLDADAISAVVYMYCDISFSGDLGSDETVLSGAVFCYDGQWYYVNYGYTIDGITEEETYYIDSPACSYLWNIYFVAKYN